MKAHVSEAKKQEVSLLKKLFLETPIIGIANIQNLPSAQFQSLRAKLKDKMLIKVTKKTLIKRVIEEIKDKKDLTKLEGYLEIGIPALIFSKEDPFRLYKIIKQNKNSAAAKAGQISPKDILIEAGPTSFPPGPIIGELGQAGIIAGVEDGKVTVKKSTLIVMEGEVIKVNVASVLAKLGIEPMEIGLNITVLYDNGLIYERKVLDVDEGVIINNIKIAYNEALSLAVSISYYTKETIKMFIAKAERESEALDRRLPKVKEEVEKMKKEEKKEEQIREQEKEKVEEVKEGLKEGERVITKDEFKKNIQKAIYSEEDAKKAQEIINAMKDADIQKKEINKINREEM